jgi:hypothetical protein
MTGSGRIVVKKIHFLPGWLIRKSAVSSAIFVQFNCIEAIMLS